MSTANEGTAHAERLVTPDGRAIGWTVTCDRGHRFTVDDDRPVGWYLDRHVRSTHRAGTPGGEERNGRYGRGEV